MFGIGGGELVFIIVIILMLFGSDKVPEIARTMGKAMAQLKNATNDIKYEIKKEADNYGLNKENIDNITGNVQSEISSVKESVTAQIENPLDSAKKSLDEIPSPTAEVKTILDDLTGPIKRQM